jgi:mono/diheme cytochrome c family protein
MAGRGIDLAGHPHLKIPVSESRMPRTASLILGATLMMLGVATAQDTSFPPEQVKRGAQTYSLNCSPCHGPRLYGEESAFDLRTFPHDQRDRFINSVTRGKNQMPPWGGLLKPDEIDALWAYVVTGEQ